MAGPLGGNTKVKLYGNGLTSSIPAEAEVFVKFGVVDAQSMGKSLVQDKAWSAADYYNELGLQHLQLRQAEQHDKLLEEGTTVKAYFSARSPDVSKSYEIGSPDVLGSGGPVYVQLGERVPIREINHQLGGKRDEVIDKIETL